MMTAGEKIKGIGDNLAKAQDYLSENLQMANCCNNVQLEPSLSITNLDLSQNTVSRTGIYGIARPTDSALGGSVRGTIGH